MGSKSLSFQRFPLYFDDLVNYYFEILTKTLIKYAVKDRGSFKKDFGPVLKLCIIRLLAL